MATVPERRRSARLARGESCLKLLKGHAVPFFRDLTQELHEKAAQLNLRAKEGHRFMGQFRQFRRDR